MQIITSKSEMITVAAFAGRLDAGTSAQVEQQLLDLLHAGPVVADFEGVSYLSSAGLRLLLKAAKQARVASVRFVVCAMLPAVREVFEVSGFDNVIPTFATRAEAVASA